MDFDQLARDHKIENVDEWKNLYASKKFDELQTRLNRLNKDLVTECMPIEHPDFTMPENEDVFDVLKRVEPSLGDLAGVILYCLSDILHAGTQPNSLASNDPVQKVDMLIFLSCCRQYDILSIFLERPVRKERQVYHIAAFYKILSDACLDNTDDNRNNFIHSFITNENVDVSLMFGYPDLHASDVSDAYIRNYIRWLSLFKETYRHGGSYVSFFKRLCSRYIGAIICSNQPDKVQCLLNEIVQQNVLSMKGIAELLTAPDTSFVSVGLFGFCMLRADEKTCSIILGLFKKEDVPKLFKQRNGIWLLTYMAIVERQDMMKKVLEYGLDLTIDEKQEFHSQLVKTSLSQNMILFLLTKKLVSCYIIPKRTSKAKKQALVYYTLKGRESLGEEEAQELITGLLSLDFEVQIRQDWEADTLEQDMTQDIQRVKDNCSVLVVFMMAHGSAEEICDADNKAVKHGYVDDIINCTASGIPEGIPKVCIIDACRERRPVLGAWKKVKNIFVSEKKVEGQINVHNYCRILAAVKGEVTYQKVMLPVLMEEWKQGGEFYDIIDRVNDRMSVYEDSVCKGILLNKHEEYMRWRPLYM